MAKMMNKEKIGFWDWVKAGWGAGRGLNTIIGSRGDLGDLLQVGADVGGGLLRAGSAAIGSRLNRPGFNQGMHNMSARGIEESLRNAVNHSHNAFQHQENSLRIARETAQHAYRAQVQSQARHMLADMGLRPNSSDTDIMNNVLSRIGPNSNRRAR